MYKKNQNQYKLSSGKCKRPPLLTYLYKKEQNNEKDLLLIYTHNNINK